MIKYIYIFYVNYEYLIFFYKYLKIIWLLDDIIYFVIILIDINVVNKLNYDDKFFSFCI